MVSSSPGLRRDTWGVRSTLYWLICYKGKHKASFVRVSSSQSHGLDIGCVSTSMGQPHCIRLTTSSLCFIRYYGEYFSWQVSPWFSLLFLAWKGVVHWSVISSCEGTFWAPLALEPFGSAPHSEVSLWSRDLCLHVWKLSSVSSKRLAFREVAELVASDLRDSTAAVYLGNWSRVFHWCFGRNLAPCKPTIQQIAEFFLYLHHDLKLLVPSVKGYCAALNHVFLLTRVDLAANKVIGRVLHSFEKSCPPREIWPPELNLSLVLRSLNRLPYEPLKWASDKHLKWTTFFLLALASAKRGSALHCIFFCVLHSRSWRSFTSFLPNFIAKTQNPSVLEARLDEFTVLLLDDFVGGDKMNSFFALSELSGCI